MSQNEAGTLTCPSCYKITDCAPSHLPRHLKMEREVSLSQLKQSGERLCGLCDDNNKAEAYCQNCISPLCSDCVSSHKRLKPLKIHKITSLENAVTPSTTSFSCTTHPCEVLKYYCSSCQTLVCSDCMLDHNNHKCSRLEDVALEGRLELWSALEKVEMFVPMLSNAIGKLDSFLESLSTNTTTVAREINDSFDELSTLIEKRREELLHYLKKKTISKKTQLEEQKKSLQSIALQLHSVTDSCTSALGDYFDAEVFAVKGSIQQAAKKVTEKIKSTDTHPVTSCSFSFDLSTEEFMTNVSTLGTILNSQLYAPLCSLVDVNPSLALGVARGQESIVILQTRDKTGEDLVVGGADVKGRVIELTSEELFSTECAVTDLCNGRYEIKFMCDIEGEYVLQITVDGISIYNCQQRVIVRDYVKMKGAVRGFATESTPSFLDLGFDNTVFVSADTGIDMFSNKLDTLNKLLSTYKNLRGVALDKQSGVVFAANLAESTIIKATLDGQVIASVGPTISSSPNIDTLSNPVGLCLTEERLLLVGDS